MSLQVSSAAKPLVAVGAGELFLPSVGSQVQLKTTGHSEFFTTFIAAVWALACMHSHVYGEVPSLAEGLFAKLTTVRSLARVNPIVSFKITQSIKSFSTLSTTVWLLTRVDSFMDSQVACIAECFATVFAAVRPLSSVSSHMSGQFSTLFKCSFTDCAVVRFLSCVTPHMYC